MKFTKIPTNTFNHLQMNAGFLTTEFTPATGTATAPMAATTGGLTFTATPEFTDFGDDIDNCPKNTKELKRITGYEVTISGNMLTIDHTTCAKLLAASTVTNPESTGAPYKFEPSRTLQSSDFSDLWFVGDYSSDNTEANGGFVAIKLINALNTGGFQLTTTDKGKGQFAFTFTGHTSIATPDAVPFELYLKETADA